MRSHPPPLDSPPGRLHPQPLSFLSLWAQTEPACQHPHFLTHSWKTPRSLPATISQSWLFSKGDLIQRSTAPSAVTRATARLNWNRLSAQYVKPSRNNTCTHSFWVWLGCMRAHNTSASTQALQLLFHLCSKQTFSPMLRLWIKLQNNNSPQDPGDLCWNWLEITPLYQCKRTLFGVDNHSTISHILMTR